jgi:hypothetical protein
MRTVTKFHAYRNKRVFYQEIIFSEYIHVLNQRQIIYPTANFLLWVALQQRQYVEQWHRMVGGETSDEFDRIWKETVLA